jgi:hypothetical protein
MNRIAIVAGLLLIGVGLWGYLGDRPVAQGDAAAPAAAENQKGASPTALIPAAFGLVIGVCGLVALNPQSRRLAMHIAAGVAFLGALAALGRGVPGLVKLLNNDPDVNRRALLFLWLMVAITVAFLALAVRSFLAARTGTSLKSTSKSGLK